MMYKELEEKILNIISYNTMKVPLSHIFLTENDYQLLLTDLYRLLFVNSNNVIPELNNMQVKIRDKMYFIIRGSGCNDNYICCDVRKLKDDYRKNPIEGLHYFKL